MATIPFLTESNFLQEVRETVFHFTRSYCGSWASTDECEDLTQEALLVLFEKIHSGEEIVLTSNLATFTNGIMKNLAKKRANKKSKQPTTIQEYGDEDAIDPIDMSVAQQSIKRWLETDLGEEQEQLITEVRNLVENMTDPCKTILWAFYWEGKSMSEIANENGYTGKDVAKSQKSRCMTKVKTAMDDIYKQMRS